MTFPLALYSDPWNIFTFVIDSMDFPSIGLTTLQQRKGKEISCHILGCLAEDICGISWQDTECWWKGLSTQSKGRHLAGTHFQFPVMEQAAQSPCSSSSTSSCNTHMAPWPSLAPHCALTLEQCSPCSSLHTCLRAWVWGKESNMPSLGAVFQILTIPLNFREFNENLLRTI